MNEWATFAAGRILLRTELKHSLKFVFDLRLQELQEDLESGFFLDFRLSRQLFWEGAFGSQEAGGEAG